MKKVLKVLLLVVAAIVVLVAIGAIIINVRGIPTYEAKKIDFKAEADSAQLARGRKLATMLCAGCHLNPETGKLTGRDMKDAPEFGQLYSQNITHDEEFGIGTWTDGEILYLLRTGILRDGRYAPPYMAKLPYMADEDIEAVIAFIRSDDPLVEATNVPDRPCEPSFLTKALTNFAFKPLPFPEAPILMPDTTKPEEWGRYLVLNLDCWTCHSPKFEELNVGEPEKTPGYLSGGNHSIKTPEGQPIVSLNLTPDNETGIGAWSEEKFINAVRFGIVEGQDALRAPMEPYNQLTNHEAKAIYAYLRTIPAISNKVNRSVID
jgi:mono/diheme cytochrome c family protein